MWWCRHAYYHSTPMNICRSLAGLLGLGHAMMLCSPSASADPAADLATCEQKLKENYAIRHTITWPANRIGGSCSSGGPSSCNVTEHWLFAKARIVQDAGLGDPSKQSIVGATTVDRN